MSGGQAVSGRGRWLALTAALLGWMFDGLEMGMFPQVARPALRDLLGTDNGKLIGLWFSVATAGFLVGAATGGVLFGWLGDRVGRVRAMTLSVVTYALFSGACGLAGSAWQVAALRFVAALGMGGEWSLGVALVMEIWPGQSRGLLAGVIGSAANLGYMTVALVGLGLSSMLGRLREGLPHLGLSQGQVEWLLRNDGWRILLLLGATPAVLTFFIRLFVPESARWQQEKQRGATSHWAARDLAGVGFGAAVACLLIALFAAVLSAQLVARGEVSLELPTAVLAAYGWAAARPLGRLAAGLSLIVVLAVAAITAGYLYPTVRYLQRAEGGRVWSPTLRRMLLGACLSAVPLLATWGSVQLAPTWADELANPGGSHGFPNAKYYTQFWSALGASFGTVLGGALGDWVGRRGAYTLLCLSALAATQALFNLCDQVDATFLALMCLAGALSASFYGWLPLFLPELFRTGVRATGQGFGFNFGRVLAAVGVLQMGNLLAAFGGSYSRASSVLCLIYVVGVLIIWMAPETRGKPLPE
jgi:MFS family permease